MLYSLRILPWFIFGIVFKATAVQSLGSSATPSLPAPIVIPASQDFDGNDGPWSSFTIQIGTPAQDVKVLISTAGYQTWTVLSQGCTSSDPPSCGILRGGQFHPNESSSWMANNVTSNSLFSLGLESNLGYSGNGEYGFDEVGLGWQGSGGPLLDQQIVAGIATKDFYLGVFGLNPRPSNFSSFDDPIPSYMSNLRKKSLIPSLSWGYSAGNQYRLNKALGSLTLGGYDSSLFIPNNVSFAFDEIDARDLTVIIKEIMFKAENVSQILSSSSIAAFVDSTVPYFYLPLEVCQKFEAAFGLTWNAEVQAYLVNDTVNDKLKAQNTGVTFTLGTLTSSNTVNISIPYAAFDLIADYPLMPNKTRYFPLVRATNDSQYTLGRTFLQEAYIVADYERRNFSISQCDWNPARAQNVVTIAPPSLEPDQTAHSRHLSIGAIVGIAIGSGIAFIFLSSAIYQLIIRNSAPLAIKAKPRLKLEMDASQMPGVEGTMLKQELDGTQNFGQELDGRIHIGYEVEASGSWVPELPVPGNNICEMPA